LLPLLVMVDLTTPFPDSGIGRALNKVSCAMNFPTFPAASPYVTAIGGTQWNNGDITHPVAWSASGGGFSWRYPAPSYQTAAVNSYLKANGGSKGFPPAVRLCTSRFAIEKHFMYSHFSAA
jgi:hypothetical protein